MKPIEMMKTTKLSIELFDPKLLKETKILFIDDYADDMDDIDDDLDDFNTGIYELSLDEFEKTLN